MNAFLDLAERQMTAPAKARQRAVERRVEARTSKADPLKELRAWHQQQLEEALAGPYGKEIAALLAFLKNLSLDDDVDEIMQGDAWRTADRDTCFFANRLINARIVELREAAGLVPFDDALPF
jgi:hypothetical protein